MGIKGALASCALGLLLTATATPVHAQDDSDDVASTQDPADRADGPAAPEPAGRDRSIVDPSGADDGVREDADRAAAKAKRVPRSSLGAHALDSDSDDNSDVDRDGVDKDQAGDEGAPKRDDRAGKKDDGNKKNKDASNKDAAKKQPAKKDAPKSDAPLKQKSEQKPGGCVEVSFEARFASIGFDHIVTLKSACKKLMKCVVRTNVNPEPASVALAPRAEESVVMWRGSPARVFTPDVSCD